MQSCWSVAGVQWAGNHASVVPVMEVMMAPSGRPMPVGSSHCQHSRLT